MFYKQLYFGYAKVILNKSLTRRQANITAERQYHSSLDEYHKSVRIYLVVAIPYGKSDYEAVFYLFLFIKRLSLSDDAIVFKLLYAAHSVDHLVPGALGILRAVGV